MFVYLKYCILIHKKSNYYNYKEKSIEHQNFIEVQRKWKFKWISSDIKEIKSENKIKNIVPKEIKICYVSKLYFYEYEMKWTILKMIAYNRDM